MTRTTVNCDECGIEKGEGNGWFAAIGSPIAPQFQTSHGADSVEEDFGDVPLFRHDLCGRECAQKVLERWLDTGSILKQDTGESR